MYKFLTPSSVDNIAYTAHAPTPHAKACMESLRRVTLARFSWGAQFIIALALLLLLGVVIALATGRSVADVSDMAAIVTALLSLIALFVINHELLGQQNRVLEQQQQTLEEQQKILSEQVSLRRLQSRPQVLAYFERRERPGLDDIIVIVIKHFGGAPALDVRFLLDTRLINDRGEEIQSEIPFARGYSVMPPGFESMVECWAYEDFWTVRGYNRMHEDAERVDEVEPLSYLMTITLRDPLGDDTEYVTHYQMDLSHLMPYAM